MNTPTGGAAFPQPTILHPVSARPLIHGQDGMSLREYFAARAPAEIPEWFGGPPVRNVARPYCPSEIASEVAEWLRDPCYDLDGVFDDEPRQQMAKAYQDATNQYDQEVVVAQGEQVIARYYAWRWHYADQMLNAAAGRPVIGFNEAEQLLPLAHLQRLVDTMIAYVVPLHPDTQYPALEAAKAFLASLPKQAE